VTSPLVSADPPLRVAILASRSVSRLRYLLEEDPTRGRTYELVAGVVSDADSEARELLEAHGVPTYTNDIEAFYAARAAEPDDLAIRAAYDRQTAAYLSNHEPDLVALSGYLHILTEPMVDRYHPRIINVHHADLTKRDAHGDPAYPGLHSVRDAVANGEPCTRETSHIVTERVDRGPLLVRSPPFETNAALVDQAISDDETDVLDAYAYAHREWMTRAAGGPTLAKTIALIANGLVRIRGQETYIDGEPDVYDLQAEQIDDRDPVPTPLD
jgi:phosphoribosylglycinamide formyltransferase-1